MTDAPKMIALRWQPGAAVTIGPLMYHPDYTRYVRQDMSHPIEQAAAQDLLDALMRLVRQIEFMASIAGTSLEENNGYQAARAAIAKARGQE